MENTAYTHIDVPQEYLDKWQKTIDLMAEVFEVPAGLIMRVGTTEIEVLLASNSEDNPYEPGEKAELNTGLYCETVMASRKLLQVPNALEDEEWKENPDVALNMISYLGVPLIRRDGAVFGTICVLDNHSRHYSKTYKQLLWQYASIIERDFQLLDLQKQLCEKNDRLRRRTHELEAKNTQLNDFAYVVSHDLKTPLRGITQLAHWLVLDYADTFDKKGKELADLLMDRAKHMHSLIEGILRYSRAGSQGVQSEELDVGSLVHDVFDLLSVPESVHLIVENELPTIVGNTVGLRQVFQNLLDNAVKFMDKPNGRIRVGYVDEGDSRTFWVADNGPGIAPQHLEDIFTIFRTFHSSDTRESTGVGLTIVKKLAELMGGSVWVESTLGQGSSFFVSLPKTGGA